MDDFLEVVRRNTLACNCPKDYGSSFCRLTWEELNDKIEYADDHGYIETRLGLQNLKSLIVCKVCMRMET